MKRDLLALIVATAIAAFLAAYVFRPELDPDTRGCFRESGMAIQGHCR